MQYRALLDSFPQPAIFRRHKSASQKISHEYGWQASLLHEKAAPWTTDMLEGKASAPLIRSLFLNVLVVMQQDVLYYDKKEAE